MKFDYYQLNSYTFKNMRVPFAKLFASTEGSDPGYLFSGKYKELIIKGEGQDNNIIADGVYLGRLPVTIDFLPKALKVIAPMITVRLAQPWAKKVTPANIPKPVGSRNSLGKNIEFGDS